MYYFKNVEDSTNSKAQEPLPYPLTIDRIDCGAPQGAKRAAMRAQANMQQQGQG